MELREQVETLQKDIAQLTELMKEKALKDQTSELRELGDKVAEVQKELAQRKIQFEAVKGSTSELSKKELATAMDELFIAKHLCVNKETGAFDQKAWEKVVSVDKYADAIKAFGDVNGIGTATQTGVTDTSLFVPTGFSAQLQEEIFLALQVAGLFPRLAMPNATYKLPFAPGRLIAKRTLEGATPVKSLPVDNQITFTAGKIMSIIEFTDELEKDSIVPILDLARRQLIAGYALAQDVMSLNGDTGTTIYSGTALAADDCRGMVNGVRRDAVAMASVFDTTAGGCTLTTIRKVRAKMGKFGVSPADLTILCSIADYNNLLQDTATTSGAAYQTLYSYGPNAVVLTGELGRLDGIPIVVTELMPNAKTSGDASDTPGGVTALGVTDRTTQTNNSKSCFAVLNRKGFMWGDRKEFSLELWRNPLNQTTNLIGSQRLDFQKVSGATSTPVALGLNY